MYRGLPTHNDPEREKNSMQWYHSDKNAASSFARGNDGAHVKITDIDTKHPKHLHVDCNHQQWDSINIHDDSIKDKKIKKHLQKKWRGISNQVSTAEIARTAHEHKKSHVIFHNVKDDYEHGDNAKSATVAVSLPKHK